MALLEIVKYPAPVLLQVGKPVTEFDQRVRKLVADMFETMYEAGGVGLAAPQVGVSERIVFLDRMTPLKREFAKRKIKKLQQTGEWK